MTPIDADTAENFNPKIVGYEIFGTASYAPINYADLDGKTATHGRGYPALDAHPGNDLCRRSC